MHALQHIATEPAEHPRKRFGRSQKDADEVDESNPYRFPTIRVGIAGPPGAGKSTFIEALGMFLCNRGHKVAVLAIGGGAATACAAATHLAALPARPVLVPHRRVHSWRQDSHERVVSTPIRLCASVPVQRHAR